MEKGKAKSILNDIISYFKSQHSIHESEGTMEDGEQLMFYERYEALHMGISALDFKEKQEFPMKIQLERDIKAGKVLAKARSHIYMCECGSYLGYKDRFCRDCGKEQHWPSEETK
jgi:hypothetical protein